MMRCRRPSLATCTTSPWRPPSPPAPPVPPRADPTGPPIAAGKGPLVLLARVTGSLESPAYAADAEIGPGMVQARADLAPVENLLVRAHVENGRLELRQFSGSYSGAAVTATGQAPLSLFSGGTSDTAAGGAVLHATAVGVTAAVLRPFVDDATISQLGGSLDARLDLVQPLAEPRRRRGRGGARTPEPGGGGSAGDSAHAHASRRPRGHRQNRELGVGERRHRRSR